MKDFIEFARVNRRLLIAVAVATGGLFAMQNYIRTGASECLGIADSKETMVSFETPVIVKRVFVLPGQQVKKGQPLVEVVPAEVNLKLMEVQTELESLESEQKVRNVLLNSLASKKGDLSDGTPISQNIAGLRRQAEELKRQQALAVRYAEEDGVVATVAFLPREQVPPFIPVITLTRHKPDLVYGFVHENRASDYKIGDVVQIQPIADGARKAEGKIVSLGSRITAFPERFQIMPNRPTYFGRELIIRLPAKNNILIGEKVRISGVVRSHLPELDFLAVADASSTLTQKDMQSKVLYRGLPLEAGGVALMADANSLFLVSDDDGPKKSPFWTIGLDGNSELRNLPVSGVRKLEDIESVSRGSDGQFYAASSLSKDKKGNIKDARNLVTRFKVGANEVVVDRSLDLRTPVLEGLKRENLLQPIMDSLDDMEIEAFGVFGVDGFFALKQPQMPDGSSIIIKIKDLTDKIEAGNLSSVSLEVYSVVRFENPKCSKPGRITDLMKTPKGMIILTNCKKSEMTGQIWYMADNLPAPTPSLLFTVHNGQPEGLGFGADTSTLYVTSDNGNVKKSDSEKKQGSDILRVNVPPQQ